MTSSGLTASPSTDRRVLVLEQRFLNRTDRLAILAPWGKPCPIKGGDHRAALLAHVQGAQAAAVTYHWATEGGKAGQKTGRFRLGTYSPAPDGTTVFGCIDCDGGSRHGNPLADPLGVALQIVLALQKVGIKAHLERSGSGSGWHVWILFGAPVPAAEVRRLLFALVPGDAPLADGRMADARANRGLEIFPKQDTLAEGKIGNMVWLPFWSGAAEGGNLFYRVGTDGEVAPYEPDDFETVAQEALDAALASIPAPAPRKTRRTFTYEGDALTDHERALSALGALNLARADNYDEWLRVGMALHSIGSGSTMQNAWDEWSRCCPAKYQEGECAKKWAGFRAGDGGVTAGTLFHMAKEDGWRPPPRPREKAPARTAGHDGPAAHSRNGHVPGDNDIPPAPADDDAAEEAPEPEDLAHLTDRGNAIRLAREHGRDLRHAHPWRKWLCWDGSRWRVDAAGAVNLRAKRMIAAMFRQALEQAQHIAKELEAQADDGNEG